MSRQFYDIGDGISSKTLPVRDLDMHFLEAGDVSAPLIFLLHGFPELAFSWRQVMIPLAHVGYYVVAPDQRGFGRTKDRTLLPGRPVRFEDDLYPYRTTNLATDILALAFALGHKFVFSVIGHDAGSSVAAICALTRPDVFRSLVMISNPFGGPPSLPFDVVHGVSTDIGHNGSFWPLGIDTQLAALNPPRKHYTSYYSGPHANEDMMHAPQGLHNFMRAYFHMKSADWKGNTPYRLPSAEASALAVIPHYYIMPLNYTMPDTVAPYMPSEETILQNEWLPEKELAVYVNEYSRTGFQGGLNWYRCRTSPHWIGELALFSRRKVDVPAMFLTGAKDWCAYQNPGGLEKMRGVCRAMDDEDVVIIDGAGHWPQQERAADVSQQLLRFLSKVQSTVVLDIVNST